MKKEKSTKDVKGVNDNKKLISEIQKLHEGMGNFSKYFTAIHMFLGGILRGAGIVVGATLIVLVGGYVLDVLGFLPGLSDVADSILDAFEQAKEI